MIEKHQQPTDNLRRRRRHPNKLKEKHTTNTMSSIRIQPYILMTLLLVAICVLCVVPTVLTLGSECYTISGEDYRGSQDRIEMPLLSSTLFDSTMCLPWNKSKEFNRPRARERGIGPHNYCRNPDGDVMPWCKVKSDGTWGYCHLPSCQVPGYIGCFLDKGNPPALDGVFVKHDGKDFTVGSCLEFCRGQGYKYAGVESGLACYCGNNGYKRYGQAVHRGNHCNTKCFGDESQACGGDGYMDVYKADLGQCGSEVQTESRGVIYNPGYPSRSASNDMAISVKAASRMTNKVKNYREDGTVETVDFTKSSFQENCDWKVDVPKARDIRIIIRKIDRKFHLGGAIEVEALGDSKIAVMLSSLQVAVGQGSSNSSMSNQVSVTAKKIIITDSIKSPGEFDIKVKENVKETGKRSRRSNADDDSEGHNYNGKSVVHSKESSWILPSSSLQPLLTVTGGRFSIRFSRDARMMTSLKEAMTLDHLRRSRSRKRQSEKEWARFAIEYEASYPEGVLPDDADDSLPLSIENVLLDEEQENEVRSSSDNRKKEKSKKKPKSKQQQSEASHLIITIHPKDTQTLIDKILTQQKGMNVQKPKDQLSDNKNVSTSIQIDVDVIVVPEDEDAKEEKLSSKQSMSEFTMPLLLAILLITTAVLIFSAVFLIFKRGGSSFFKNKKNGKSMVVSLEDDLDQKSQYQEKNDKVNQDGQELYLTSQENDHYSPNKRNSASIKTLIDLLKHHPGMFQRSRNDGEYKHVSCGRIVPTDPSAHTAPCPYCCTCQQNQEANESCRHPENSAKLSPSSRSSGKNIRGLSVKTPKSKAVALAPAPPLSPITEVSSVASSTLSLSPITSPNSMTSLLPRTTQAHAKQGGKTVTWKLRSSMGSLKGDANANPEETSAFLAPETSDAESGIEDFSNSKDTKNKVQNNIHKNHTKPKSKVRYLGGNGTSCYDSGYATSNYEEEDEDGLLKSEKRLKTRQFELEGDQNIIKNKLMS